jgi:autotransporter-associated beta strand protein
MTGNSKFTVESANPNANMSWGWFNMGDMGATANITLSNNASFAVTQSQMCIAGSTGGKGHVTLNGSATFSVAGAVHMNGWDTTVGDEAVINLNGGSFAASQFIAEAGAGSVINFNGGALKATANSGDFIALRNATASIALNVQAGGAKIDTDGYNVQVSRSLQHDPASGAPAIDGGLTKLGAGTLGLHSQSSYTGSTVVNDGTLQLLSGVTTQLASTPDNMKGDREDGAYSLGRDFTVNTGKSIQVTQLGVFDSLGDGLEASHVVHISSIDGLTDYAVKTFASGTANPYQRGFRFITLDAPLSLTEGTYRVWVDTIGGDGNDFFSGTLATLDAGITGAVTIGGSYYGSPAGSMPTTGWNDGSGSANADATFSFYDPSGFIAANALPITTPVVLGGATGSTPALDLNGMDQQVASLADVAGAAVLGTVTNSKPSVPVVLTLGAESGSKTYTGAITGNLSLVKDGGSMQSLLGALTYVGDTTVNAGELIVTNLNTPANTVSVMDGATLTATSIVADTLVIGGTPSPAPLAVPEPGTFALLVFAAFGALLAWRRK